MYSFIKRGWVFILIFLATILFLGAKVWEKFGLVDQVIEEARSDQSKVQALDSGTAEKVKSTTRETLAKIEALKNKPTTAFVSFVEKLDSLGYSADTVRVKRLKNYEELLHCPITLIDGFPFYKLKGEQSKILKFDFNDDDKSDSVETKVFRDAQQVWAYYYAKPGADNTVVDGVIEQWKFADKKSATLARTFLNDHYPLPFFNTEPCYYVSEQYVFIFHTRASAFSYIQKKFFESFQKSLDK